MTGFGSDRDASSNVSGLTAAGNLAGAEQVAVSISGGKRRRTTAAAIAALGGGDAISLRGKSVAVTAPASGDRLIFDGTNWIPAGHPAHAVIAGGAAGNHTVTGIKVTDILDEVIAYQKTGGNVSSVVDLTGECTINAADKINNTGGTDTTNGTVVVRWTKLEQ